MKQILHGISSPLARIVLSLLLMILSGVTNVWADEVTFDFTSTTSAASYGITIPGSGEASDLLNTTVTSNDVQLKFYKGESSQSASIPKFTNRMTGCYINFYAGNYFTVSAPNNYKIIKITATGSQLTNTQTSTNWDVAVNGGFNVAEGSEATNTVTFNCKNTGAQIKTLTVTYAKECTVNWSVDGTITTQDLLVGDALSAPTVVNPDGYTFKGWVTSPMTEAQQTAPAYADIPATVPSSTEEEYTLNYYAVFAKVAQQEKWQKVELANITSSDEGQYAFLTSDYYAFNGTITTGTNPYGSVTTNSFSFDENNYATSAPEGTCILKMTKEVDGETTKLYFQDANSNEYFDVKIVSSLTSTSLSLTWNDSKTNYWTYENENLNNSVDEKAYLRSFIGTSTYFKAYKNNASGSSPVVIAHKLQSEIIDYSTSAPSAYTRTVTGGNLGSICLPRAAIVSGCTGVSKVFQVTDVTSSSVTLSSVDEMVAGVPYIFRSAAVATSITINCTGAAVSEPDNSTQSYLVGNFAPADVPASTSTDACYILQKNQFKYVNSSSITSGYNRCYLKAPAPTEGARETLGITIADEGTPTAIDALNAVMTGDAQIYDINGRKLQTLQQGINIVNGKKIIIK